MHRDITSSKEMHFRLKTFRFWTFQHLRCSFRKSEIINLSWATLLVCMTIFVVLYSGFMTSPNFVARNLGRRVSLPLASYPIDGIGISAKIRGEYNFSIFNSFCERHQDLVAIIPIYSAADNFQRRQAIRDTIGRSCAKFKCAVFFIIGVSLNASVYEDVKAEYRAQTDILMVSKIDTYRDLNNKAMAMLNWLTQFCPQPKYVLHIIDDTYPNMQYFIDHLNSIKEAKFILGFPYLGARPIADTSDKWFSDEAVYPYRLYPLYAVGVAYAFRNSDSKLLRDAAYKAEHYWIEDVWLTGLVRKEAGFTLVSVTKQLLETPSSKDPDIWKTYFCVHQVDVPGFYDIFNATQYET